MAQTQPSVFGTLLRQFRLTTGLTQEELAERAQISARTVSDLERGIAVRPHVHTVQRLADALGLSENDCARLLEARPLARDAPMMSEEQAAPGRPALHIVSERAGPQSAVDPDERGAAAPHRARDTAMRSARHPATSRTTRVDMVRQPGSRRSMVVAVVLLLLLAGGLALLRAFDLPRIWASPSALAARLDAHWPLPGSAPGTLRNPEAVATDPSGNVYVADTGNNRVDRFSSSGRFLGSFGSRGSGPGQFRQPRGIAADGSGHVYVSDTGNDRIEKFSSGGTWLASWGSRGSSFGRFRSPRGMAIDPAGKLFVADRNNNRIQEFSTSGTFLRAWGPGIPTGPDLHPPPGLYRPVGVALDRADNIFVVDARSTHLHEFSPYAVPLGDWGATGSGVGRLIDPTAIAVEADGTVVVGQTVGTPLLEYAVLSHEPLTVQPHSPSIHAGSIALESDGTVLVADSATSRVLRLDRNGRVTARFGTPAIEPERLSAPGSLALDPAGDLFVADTGHRRVVELDPDGRPVAALGGGMLGYPRSVAVGRGRATLYVVDSAHGRVQQFTSGGKLLTSWRGFSDPRGIAVDAAGTVYVTDDMAGTMQKLTGSGASLAVQTIAPPAITNGIGALATDRHGITYVAVPGQGIMLKLSSTGQVLAEWAHFHGDIAIAVDRLNRVYVADAGRFQEFSAGGQVLRTVRLPGAAHGGPPATAGIAVDAGFNVFVSDGATNRIYKYSPGAAG